jgi:hypothetical protein
MINRFQSNTDIYKLERTIAELKSRIFMFEMGSFKSKEKINIVYSDINKTLQTLKTYHNNIRGFNLWSFGAGFCIFHMSIIFYKKRLLYEFNKGEYIRHIGLCTMSGMAWGCIVGYIFYPSG